MHNMPYEHCLDRLSREVNVRYVHDEIYTGQIPCQGFIHTGFVKKIIMW